MLGLTLALTLSPNPHPDPKTYPLPLTLTLHVPLPRTAGTAPGLSGQIHPLNVAITGCLTGCQGVDGKCGRDGQQR